VNPGIWLLATVIAAVAAYLIGAPAWAAYRSRSVRDLNAERYLAWRGRADRRPVKEEMTSAERSRLLIGGALALVAVFCLVGFFTYR